MRTVTYCTENEETPENIHWSSRNSRIDGDSAETGTTVSGATNVKIAADGDITARAATLSAGDALSVDAGGKLLLYAGQNQTYAQTQQSQRSGMSYSKLDASSSETTLACTTLTADNVKLHSGGDTTLGAVTVNADTLGIKTEGKLNLLTQTTTSTQSINKSSGDAAFVGAATKGHVDDTTNYNQFNVASVHMQAAGGINANVRKGRISPPSPSSRAWPGSTSSSMIRPWSTAPAGRRCRKSTRSGPPTSPAWGRSVRPS